MEASKPISGIDPGFSKASGGSKYNFTLLTKPGDSMFYPNGDLKNISGALTHHRRVTGQEWTCRMIDDGRKWGKEYEGVKGVAVWYLGKGK